MSLQFQFVWALLSTEIVAVLLLLFSPTSIKLKNRLLKFIVSGNGFGNLWHYLRVVFVLILILFVDAGTKSIQLTRQKRLFNEKREKDATLNELQFNLKLFYAQRNTYLTGFTLFLAIILKRVLTITLEKTELEEENNQLKAEFAKLNKQDTLLKKDDIGMAEGEEEKAELKLKPSRHEQNYQLNDNIEMQNITTNKDSKESFLRKRRN